jgi:hypothetical protein
VAFLHLPGQDHQSVLQNFIKEQLSNSYQKFKTSMTDATVCQLCNLQNFITPTAQRFAKFQNIKYATVSRNSKHQGRNSLKNIISPRTNNPATVCTDNFAEFVQPCSMLA